MGRLPSSVIEPNSLRGKTIMGNVRSSTGIEGIDEILHGGLVRERSYMVRGRPGSGKTVLGLHFLTATEDRDTLFINLGESQDDIEENVEKLGFDLSSVEFLDLSPSSDFFAEDKTYDIFAPDEVEEDSITQQITEKVKETSPESVFIDPITQFRYLSPDAHQFRKQVLSLLRFLKDQEATVLFTSENTTETPDDDLRFMSDGIIQLDPGSEKRTVEVTKFRGSDFRSGEHAMRINADGISVFPKLVLEGEDKESDLESISSGVPEFDELLNGGIERGTLTILTGPSGVGKTTTGTQFMKEAAGRGERSVIYMFEENMHTFFNRSRAINIPVREMMDRGTLSVEEINPVGVSVDEFSNMVKEDVEKNGTDIVMIDGIDGYKLSLQRGETEDELTRELHSLSKYLKNRGVTIILINETKNITGDFHVTGHNISYLADNIVFLRYLEIQGELKKAVGVLKKRASDFERNLREIEITEHGIKVGKPFTGLRGILGGTPEFVDSETNDTESRS